MSQTEVLALVERYEEQLVLLNRRMKAMKAGLLRVIASSDGLRPHQTPRHIERCRRQVAQLERLLSL